MTPRSRVAALLSTGLLVVALAGCAEPGSSSGPGARPAEPVEQQRSGGSESPGPSASASPTPTEAPTPIAELSSLSGVRTQVTFGQSFLTTLRDAALKPVAVGNATLSGAGLLSLPITGGSLRVFDATAPSATPTAQGSIAHRGSGLELTGGNKRVAIRNLVIDPGSGRVTGAVSVDGAAPQTDVPVFTVDESALETPAKSATGAVVLRGATLSFTPQAAKLVNDTFGAQAVTDSRPVGTVVVAAK